MAHFSLYLLALQEAPFEWRKGKIIIMRLYWEKFLTDYMSSCRSTASLMAAIKILRQMRCASIEGFWTLCCSWHRQAWKLWKGNYVRLLLWLRFIFLSQVKHIEICQHLSMSCLWKILLIFSLFRWSASRLADTLTKAITANKC